MNIFKKRTPCKGIFPTRKPSTSGRKFFDELQKLNPWAIMFFKEENNMAYISDFDVLSLKIPKGYERVMEELMFTNGKTIINIKLYG